MKNATHFQIDDRVWTGREHGIVVGLDHTLNEVCVILENGEKLWYVADGLSRSVKLEDEDGVENDPEYSTGFSS